MVRSWLGARPFLPGALLSSFVWMSCQQTEHPGNAGAGGKSSTAGVGAGGRAGSSAGTAAGTASAGLGGAGTGGATSGGSAGHASGAGAGTGTGGNGNSGAASAGQAAGAATAGAAPSGGTAGGSAGTVSNAGSAGSVVGSGGDGGDAGGTSEGPASILVFSRTLEYRHDSIPAGIAALTAIADARGFQLDSTEDPSRFRDDELATRDLVIFLSTSGDVLGPEEEAAFERFIRAGGAFVGVHSASACEYDWTFYGDLVGALFREHPDIQSATVRVENTIHPATAGLPSEWMRIDEWYSFRDNPRNRVNVLLSLDEDSYAPGASEMDGDHPIAWFHEYEGSRSFYTALGHTSESYSEPQFLAHLAGGIDWALDR